ncbi:hypothetical protein K461DRAFT_110933 [Myriangium duriaei CBS 260.36]|uniref:Uncharacterized protein n=1 Tax=Myriangium duriaei CBS 260.36 TaxID=1168546 RepID=A0A9P4MMJ9_9PEZI|nr:hypothetical protein K461DRAFT_110933 [Myriangium duriaei CBS 260.36]
MGNVNSHASLAPISYASTIIGFISFTFTLATFLRVFWENLTTLGKANSESRTVLSTLRTELEEERLSLRELKRHQRVRGYEGGPPPADVLAGPQLDYAALHALQISLRRLNRRFEELEEPFLIDGAELDARKAARRRSRSRGEKGGGDESGDDWRVEDLYSAQSLGRRWRWLQSRGEAVKLLDSVNRLQTRRIARQVGEIACLLHSYKETLDEMRHGVAVTEGRMARVVGVRRVD